MALGVTLNNLPRCAAAGTADGQFTSTGYVPPLQGTQFTTPQTGCDGQRVVRPIQNRFVLNGKYMELQLICSFSPETYPLLYLKEHGLSGNVQGPRRFEIPVIQS